MLMNAPSGIQDGKYEVKKLKEDQTGNIVGLFGSIEGHTLSGDCVTVEKFLDGTSPFSKYVNDTGDIYPDGSEVCLKAETFVYYTYEKSGKKLMVVDIQGKGYDLCDPEIASADLRNANDQVQAVFSFVLETCLVLPLKDSR